MSSEPAGSMGEPSVHCCKLFLLKVARMCLLMLNSLVKFIHTNVLFCVIHTLVWYKSDVSLSLER